MKYRPEHAKLILLSLLTLGTLSAAEARGAEGASTPCTTDNLLAGKPPLRSTEVRGDAALVTDGAIAPEGAEWDAPAAIQLESRRGSLTYDLGRAVQVSGFVLEADANDSYQIAGSTDGTSFRPLAEAPNVVDRGHGLRLRAVSIAPATIRYLRVGEGEGDGFFSIAEFAAYCKTPTPFPPTMKVVDAPMAAVPVPAGEQPAELVTRKPETPIGGLQIALLAAIAILAGALVLRRSRAGVGAIDAGGRATVGDSRAERYFPLVLLLFIGSGCAALMYEIIWFQLLQLVLGSSAVSIGVLLGMFMAGMCIGSLVLPRYVSSTRHPLRVYAYLELAIGASGLLMLAAMPLVQGAYTSIVGHGVPGLLLRGLFAAICLLPPTAMMGATLPAVARWVRTTPRGVSWLGYFYGANTIGAVLGCLLAGFYLLRVYSMPIATFVAVALNAIVAVAALALAKVEPSVSPEIAPAPESTVPESDEAADDRGPPDAWAIYLSIGLSGLTALAAEVIWTRLFSLLLSGSTYTFSIILAVFLIGIGFGSAAGSTIARRTTKPRRALGIAQLLLIVAVAWTAWNISGALPYWPVNPTLAGSPWFQFQIDFVRSLWAILPAALLWGASFPLALASVATGRRDGSRIVGYVYAANTVGAIVGALATSLVLVRSIGTQDGQRLLVVLLALSAIAALVPLFGRKMVFRRPDLKAGFAILAVVFVASLVYRNIPPVPPVLIGHGRLVAAERHYKETYLYVGEGMNSSPAVSRDVNGILSYHNAGKVQASSQPQDMRLQRMLGHLTTLVPKEPKKVLVIACGAGVTAGAASIDPRVEQLTIAEIEPLVPHVVAKYFGEHNFNVVKNPKVRVEVDDARHFLNTTREKFDAITSDPFDPWVKGAATLYTKEFWELAKRHLNPGGVVTVFVQLYDSGMAAVKSEVATFFEVFPNGIIWGNTVRGQGYDVVLSGQVGDVRIDVDHMEQLLAKPEFEIVARSLRQIGFNSATALLSTYGGRGTQLGPWLSDAEINRDSNLRLQFLAGLGMNVDQRAEIYRGILAHRQYPDDLFLGSPQTLAALREQILQRR
jgi:spermidine synthase